MSEGSIEITSVEDGIGRLVLNRPAKHNAITPEMADQLRTLRQRINDDDAIRVVLLAGAGEKSFCAGTDMNSLGHYADAWAWRNRVCYASEVRAIRKPVIAALKGWVLGGGLEIALNCDIRIAAETARFGAPEVTHGWLGGAGMTQMLTRLVGYGQSMLLNLTGDPIDAPTALSIGLVERVVAAGEEEAEAMRLAQRIAAHSPVATQTVKNGVRAALESGLAAGAAHENDLMVLAFALGAQRSGVDAFRRKQEGTRK
jgi:enoyl-CoA hydratase/carnithine racemase